jgi:hypothetical protein
MTDGWRESESESELEVCVMNNKGFLWATSVVAVLGLGLSAAALGEDCPKKFTGQINAYTAQTSAPSPYEIRGPWSLKLSRDGKKADFSAALNMVLTDGFILTRTGPPTNPPNFDPSGRNAHTHHITMNNADVTVLSTGALQIVGTATVTLNGGVTPFAQQSKMTVVISGGVDVKYSNVTMTFDPAAPAAGHFGSEPLPGVVRTVKDEKGDH